MSAYAWDYTVTGQDRFPLDMLRYDASYPIDQESVSEMVASSQTVEIVERRKAAKLFKVNLRSRVGAPEVARWSSFGWRVATFRKERVSVNRERVSTSWLTIARKASVSRRTGTHPPSTRWSAPLARKRIATARSRYAGNG
jgi:hypothetical protein